MSVTEIIASDRVLDEEILYRSVRQQASYIVKDAAGRLRVSSAAFDDHENEVSLFRHNLCDAPPLSNPPRLGQTDFMVSLLASHIREQRIQFGNNGEVFRADVRPDTTNNQHTSHAVVYPDRTIGSKVFLKLKKRMAEIAEETWAIPPDPNFVASLLARATEPV